MCIYVNLSLLWVHLDDQCLCLNLFHLVIMCDSFCWVLDSGEDLNVRLVCCWGLWHFSLAEMKCILGQTVLVLRGQPLAPIDKATLNMNKRDE